jgi:diguanylate cyclase (GGDEF)-like protein
MAHAELLRRIRMPIGVAVLYLLAAKFGLRLAFVHASATAVWPPAGIALGAFLVFGRRVWPAVMVGAFLANVTTAGSVATSLGIAAGNTLEAIVGASLVNRYAGGVRAFERARHVLTFALLAGLVSTTVAATCGVTVLSLEGFADWADYGSIWLTWWLGDAAGVLIVGPAFVLWWTQRPAERTSLKRLEAVLLLACLVVCGQVVFGGWFPSDTKDYSLEFLCMPVLVWCGLRFGQRAAATALLIMSGLAIRGTLDGLGPFARATQNASLLLVQAFTAVLSLTTLTLAALVAERREAEEQLRKLAVSDALTGIANYRRLISALLEQIGRAERRGESFTVVLLDVDHLKKINDRHGHLVGGRALCRVAEALVACCRNTDMPARFGGDEFAVLLPDSDEAAAWKVSERVAAHLAGDGEMPPVSVSVGVALYPRDGESADALLGAADRLLYEMKARGEARSRA